MTSTRKLILTPAIAALAFSASACKPMPILEPVLVVDNVPALVVFDAPQAPGPELSSTDPVLGGDATQAPPANCEPQYCGEKAP